jgi:hypothetical protein
MPYYNICPIETSIKKSTNSASWDTRIGHVVDILLITLGRMVLYVFLTLKLKPLLCVLLNAKF